MLGPMLRAILDDFRGLGSAFGRENRYDCLWDVAAIDQFDERQ